MKKHTLLFLFTFTILLISCKGNNQKEQEELFCNPDFNVFFEEFANDSLYQRNHVTFPLKLHYVENEMNGTTNEVMEYVNERNFRHFLDMKKHIEKKTTKDDYKSYNNEITKTTERVADTMNCIYTLGVRNINYRFMYKDNCWHLFAIVDNHTYAPNPFNQSKINNY